MRTERRANTPSLIHPPTPFHPLENLHRLTALSPDRHSVRQFLLRFRSGGISLRSTALGSTALGSTVLGSTAQGSTAPSRTALGSTTPGIAAHGTAPASTTPGGTTQVLEQPLPFRRHPGSRNPTQHLLVRRHQSSRKDTSRGSPRRLQPVRQHRGHSILERPPPARRHQGGSLHRNRLSMHRRGHHISPLSGADHKKNDQRQQLCYAAA